uniref:chitinase n=1 Tax=Leersia perrieri TaxID=77586 RepID=A0A0D9WCI6_9ORYZ
MSPINLLAFFFLAASSFIVSDAGDAAAGCSHVASIVTEELYNKSFLHKDDAACPAKNFYTYAAFLRAADRFPRFGAVGGRITRRREVAAFLAQISHETTGGWATAPDGPYSWGLCFKEEIKPAINYCDNVTAAGLRWPCVAGKSYHGHAVVAFKTALWFWMTPQPPKPSCHDVMTGRYRPSRADMAANRTAGFGLTTNIINGGLECNRTDDPRVNDRIGFFRRYSGILGVNVGDNLDCAHQLPYS